MPVKVRTKKILLHEKVNNVFKLRVKSNLVVSQYRKDLSTIKTSDVGIGPSHVIVELLHTD